MNIHVVRSCPYWLEVDVWLTELTNAGFGALLELGGQPCEPCMAVVTSPPMLKADGGDDGRLMWHMHCRLRSSLRTALSEQGYEEVVTDGRTVLYRGPSADIEVRWNQNWKAGAA